MGVIKLQKAAQTGGLGSRRSIRQAIHAGEFKVNHLVVTDPNHPVDPRKDIVHRAGKLVRLTPEPLRYILFNKPYGVITSLKDPQGRPTIQDYLKGIRERLVPVGRLDYNSEGLVLLTNDGNLTHFIISARNEIPKTYQIKIKGILTDAERDLLLSRGKTIDGSRIIPRKIEYIKKTAQNSWVSIEIVEGKKHVVRNLFRYSGHPVDRLRRVAIGSFKLGSLKAGQLRPVSTRELAYFKSHYGYPAEG